MQDLPTGWGGGGERRMIYSVYILPSLKNIIPYYMAINLRKDRQSNTKCMLLLLTHLAPEQMHAWNLKSIR